MTTLFQSGRLAGWCLASIVLVPEIASGQLAELVADPSPGVLAGIDGSISSLERTARQVFFTVDDETGGREIWATDGSNAGTRRIALVDFLATTPDRELDTIGGRVVWRGYESRESSESTTGIWASDGTLARPRLLLAVTAEGAALAASSATKFGGDLVFTSVTATEGWGIWRTDGTPQGTRQVVSNPLEGRSFGGEKLFVVGDHLLFFINGNFQRQLISSDGTDAGTMQVQVPIAANELFNEVVLATSTHAFFSTFGDLGHRLWSLEAGRTTPSELTLGEGAEVIQLIAATRSYLYFWAASPGRRAQIWRTDGTDAGTRRITSLPASNALGSGFDPTPVAEAGGRVYFIALDERSQSAVWSTDGDPSSMRRVLPDCPDVQGCNSTRFDSPLLAVGSSVVFTRQTNSQFELLLSDGTEAGTRSLASLCGPGCEPYADSPVRLDGMLYFAAVGTTGALEIWSNDGTAAGTQRLVRLPPAARNDRLSVSRWLERVPGGWIIHLRRDFSSSNLWFFDDRGGSIRQLLDFGMTPASSMPSELTVLDDRVLFQASTRADENDVFTRRLLASGASQAGADTVDFIAESSPLDEANGLAYYFKPGFPFPELWRSDGTRQGTSAIWTASDAADPPLPAPGVVELGGETFFSRSAPADLGIWQTDGSVAGTRRILALDPRSFRAVTVPVRGRDFLLFGTYDWFNVLSVWSYRPADGEPRDLLSRDVNFEDPLAIRGSVELGEATLFFVCVGGSFGFGGTGSLLRTDGTVQGTELLLDLPAVCSAHPPALAALGDLAFVQASSSASNMLVVSDGTRVGTKVLRNDDRHSAVGSQLMAAFGDRAYFTSSDDEAGLELWRTDGTAAGTARFSDLWPGPASSRPTWLTAAGGRLFFVANDGVHGFELWSTDGTEAGTRLVHDLSPGVASSRPAELTVAGDHLFFSADDGLNGRELWMLPLAGGAACRASERALCVQDGRFRVEAKWRDFRGREGAGKAVSLTADTGYFWFFNQENVEAVVKVLDGRGNNEHFWTFYGALSNVEYHLTVTDAQTGLSRRYANSSGAFASVGDTRSFGPLGASSEWSPEALEATFSAPPPTIESSAAAAGEPCVASPTRLCLNGGRFAVEASWRDFRGREGVGTAVSVSGDTGYFWFFDQANVETMVKVLDGRGNNGNFWVFYGALSNVDYDLTVTDTTTGQQKTYQNRNRAFASVGDTGAFAGS